MPSFSTPSWTASQLRRDLSDRAARLARTHGLLHDVSTGASPTVLFGRDEQGRHGNFHPAAYDRICANAEWLRRDSPRPTPPPVAPTRATIGTGWNSTPPPALTRC